MTSGGVFRAASIKAAEAAKVIENAQRDINIAFMNEITQIFAKMDISVWDVLAAAGTKWNFLKFEPGLVGGHCIGVDPYYLAHRATELGCDPRIVLAGRDMNDGMASWVANSVHTWHGTGPCNILMLGLTFKPNVPDLRNSKVADLVFALRNLGHQIDVHDPLVCSQAALDEYGIDIIFEPKDKKYNLIILAVPHRDIVREFNRFSDLLINDGGVADLNNALAKSGQRPNNLKIWTM